MSLLLNCPLSESRLPEDPDFEEIEQVGNRTENTHEGKVLVELKAIIELEAP